MIHIWDTLNLLETILCFFVSRQFIENQGLLILRNKETIIPI